MTGKSPHMHFINDHILEGHPMVYKSGPVKGIFNHSGVIRASRRIPASPDTLAGNSPCIRIQQITAFVKNQSPVRIIRTVHPVSIFNLIDIQIKHNHGIRVAHTAVLGKRKHRKGFCLSPSEKTQFASCGIHRMDGKADSARHQNCPIGQKKSRPYPETSRLFIRNRKK